MPKIRIREVDNTGTVSSSEIPNVVYIPGPAAEEAVGPELFTSAKAFNNAIHATGSKYSPGSLSEKMAYHLLLLGMHVLYEGLELESSTGSKSEFNGNVDIVEETPVDKFTLGGIEFTISSDKSKVTWKKGTTTKNATITDADGVYQATVVDGQDAVIKDLKDNLLKFDFLTNKVYYTKEYSVTGEPTSQTWKNVWTNLTDKNLYDVRFLTTGQFFADEENAKDMLTCAATRCDAVALLDFKTTYDDVDEYRDAAEAVENSSEALTLDAKDPAAFAAAFAPKWKGNVSTESGVEAIDNLPPSFAYLCAFARSVKENPMWYAVAGSFRGVIPELVEVKKKYTTADVERLQARGGTVEVALDGAGDNVGVAINPIAYRRPFGYLIYGDRTLRRNLADEVTGVGKLKATSFLNCRILSTEVAKVSYNASNKYQFEQNSETLWTNFISYILPTLDRMSTGNGILDYKIERVSTDKRARLSAKISLEPIEPVEDFDIEIELTDSISVSAS